MPHTQLPEYVVLLPSGGYREHDIAAVGMVSEFRVQKANASTWKSLDNWIAQQSSWIFGFIAYDAKNGIENLTSERGASIAVPDIHLFVPQCVVKHRQGVIEVLHGEWNESLSHIFDKTLPLEQFNIRPSAVQSKEEYLEAVGSLLDHIHRGDIYEVNYCQQFNASIDLASPFDLFKKLHHITDAPHSVFLRIAHLHVMCGSPERFLSRIGDTITSQPIKGTIKRSLDPEEDELLKMKLRNSQKEISENVMIVDLVRNDLSRSAIRGSVQVEELFEVKSFKTVHHLVSTITSKVHDETSFGKLIQDTFPMGSMTGAPKVKAIELIDQYEYVSRGLYSGTVGYIMPNGDFDFNVVIRSLVYDHENKNLVFNVGGAITAECNPDAEYEECMLKAEALLKALA